MATILINVGDFGAEHHDGDRVSLYAPRFRKSASNDRLVSTAPRSVGLVNGQASVSNVDPGPLVIEFACRNILDSGPFNVVVPEGVAEITLHDLMVTAYNYAPEVVSRASDLLSRATAIEKSMRELTSRSESAADRIGSAEQVESWVAAVGESERSAASSAESAAGAASEARASAASAEGSATAAGNSASAAGASATAAGASADAAAKSASEAAKSESAAAGSASSAQASADRAGNIAASTSWSGDVLTVNGQSSPPLTGPKGDPGDQGRKGDPGEPGAGITIAGTVETSSQLPNLGAGDAGKAYLSKDTGLLWVWDGSAWPSAGVEFRGPKGDPGDDGKPGTTSWAGLTDKPATFPPSAHAHEVSQVTGLQAALDGKAASSHTHTWDQVTGKPATFPPSAHAHEVSQVTGLQAALDGKAASTHSHTISQVSNLQAELNGKLATSEAVRIEVVTELPSTPVSTTLYFVKE